MDRTVARLNIEHYRKLLSEQMDEPKRQTILRLLAEEEANAQHLVVLLDPNDIVSNLHHAYRDPRFTTARYAVLVTGPSATADIEGVLIHGAQGVRSLTVVPVARGG
jgi:L-lactate utilization protein LutC